MDMYMLKMEKNPADQRGGVYALATQPGGRKHTKGKGGEPGAGQRKY